MSDIPNDPRRAYPMKARALIAHAQRALTTGWPGRGSGAGALTSPCRLTPSRIDAIHGAAAGARSLLPALFATAEAGDTLVDDCTRSPALSLVSHHTKPRKMDGAGGRIRTLHQLITIQPLYH